LTVLDERWSEDAEAIGEALRKLLCAECTPERVRAAEAASDGRDRAFEAKLGEFGLNELTGSPELFARVAFELGRALAPCAFVESMPVLAVLGLPNIAYGFDGLAPAAAGRVATSRDDGVYVQDLVGSARRSAAGDFLIPYRCEEAGELIGNAGDAERIRRFADMVDAARMVGAGQRLLEYGVAYARERQQFGKLIGSYQGVAHRLAGAATALDSAELMLRKSAFTAAQGAGGDGAPPVLFAVMVRVKAIDAARGVATAVHQVFGGYGFAMEYDVQLYSRRLRSWAMRGKSPGHALAELGHALLDPTHRDAMRHLWHYESGMPLPRWAREVDGGLATRPHRAT
jgi:alkylation response protein AidB-like acyl-CoA dehydrogenase